MKNLIKTIFLFIPLAFLAQNGGVNIGSGNTNHPSAILQVENTNNKGVLFPQVELLDKLSNTSEPIANPINGMVVYNIGNAQLHGYYFWDQDTWKLITDSNNAITDAVYRMTVPTSYLGGKAINNFQDVNSNWAVFSNNVVGITGTPSGDFTLPAGNYLVNINANIDISILKNTSGVAGSDLHLIKLQAKLYNGASTIYGTVNGDNGTMKTTNHKYNTNFDFIFRLDNPATMRLALATENGGTYSNGVGGNAPNNGNITINNISIHFQRSTNKP